MKTSTAIAAKESKLDDDEKYRLLPSCRLTVTFYICFSLICLGLLRVNLSMALVCMAKKTTRSSVNETLATTNDNVTQLNDDDDDFETTTTLQFRETSSSFDSITRAKKYEGEFEWSRSYQGFLLSSYFYGYMVTQFLGGYLAGRFGGKHVLSIAMFVAVIATLLIPAVARFNPYLLIFLRAVVGAGSGLVYPAAQTLFGIWAPPLERSFLSSLGFGGLFIGYIAAFFLSSQFCQMRLDNGWPMAFYSTGGFSLLFLVFWNIFIFSSPDEHPRISQRESNYIKTATGLKSEAMKKRKPFPLLKALKSPAVLSLVVVQSSVAWFGYTQATSIPLYLRDVLKFDIKQNGLYIILVYVSNVLANVPISYLADVLRTKKILSTVAVRKISQSLCNFLGAIFIVIISFLDYNNRYVAVGLLITLSATMSFGRIGFLVNPQDIAPRYSGEVFGIANTMATVAGSIAPIAVGQLTPNGTQQEWGRIFYISAAIFVFCDLVFIIFGKGEVEPWAKDDVDNATMTVVNLDGSSDSEGSNCQGTDDGGKEERNGTVENVRGLEKEERKGN